MIVRAAIPMVFDDGRGTKKKNNLIRVRIRLFLVSHSGAKSNS